MSTPDPARKFRSLLKRLKVDHPEADASPPAAPALEGCDTGVALLIHSFFLWEAAHPQAVAAMKRVAAEIVDSNELRVCVPEELARLLGPRYPRVQERTERLLASLQDLYIREHDISMTRLAGMPKRDAKTYLDSLQGMVPFVSARVQLLWLGCHAFPVDVRLAHYLHAEGVASEAETPEAVEAWLERQVRAGEALGAYLLIERGCEAAGVKPPRKRPAKKPAAKDRAKTDSKRPAANKP